MTEDYLQNLIFETPEDTANLLKKDEEFLESVKGEDGHTPTTEELEEIIIPLIPEPLKGEDGKTPSKKELVSLILPLIPDPIVGAKGEPGKDGKDAVLDEKILEPIIEKFSSGMKVLDGRVKLIDQRWGAHGGGLSKVSHDATLGGSGIPSDPLTVLGGSGGGVTDGTTITGTGVVADPITLNLGHANTWTVDQTFSKIIKSGGLTTGFLKANGDVDSSAYITGVTVDSPLTGAGTSTSHLSMPAASSSVNGYLTSTDWTTFNNKPNYPKVVATVDIASSNESYVDVDVGEFPAGLYRISYVGFVTDPQAFYDSADWYFFFSGQGGQNVTSPSFIWDDYYHIQGTGLIYTTAARHFKYQLEIAGTDIGGASWGLHTTLERLI